VQQGATGASAKLRLGLLKSLSKIDCGPKGLENARFFWGFGSGDTQWGIAPGPPLGDGALRLASLGQLQPQDENLATALLISQEWQEIRLQNFVDLIFDARAFKCDNFCICGGFQNLRIACSFLGKNCEK
jgi:hypothetical protein